jgi:dTDP-glucose 4,6-dehydratase
MKNFIVTGGAGFIGGHLVDLLVSKDAKVVVLDKFTYATKQQSNVLQNEKVLCLTVDLASRRHVFEQAEKIQQFFSREPFSIFHLAAESHVDRSINSGDEFVLSNVLGTQVMLDFSAEYRAEKFLHVSTDEVYGSLIEGQADEESPLNPSSAYSATKAGSDLLVSAHRSAFASKTVITRCVNNFGPRQSLEKFIPRAISKTIQGQPVPIYGTGENIREWIYVKDHCRILYEIMLNGAIGEIYNIGSGARLSNLEVIDAIERLIGSAIQREFVDDRKGHDFRYALDSRKVNQILPNIKFTSFDKGMIQTLKYYQEYSLTPEFRLEFSEIEEFYGN